MASNAPAEGARIAKEGIKNPQYHAGTPTQDIDLRRKYRKALHTHLGKITQGIEENEKQKK